MYLPGGTGLMESLLEKARSITEVVESAEETRMDPGDVTARLAAVTLSTVLVVDNAGNVLALSLRKGHQLREEVGVTRELPRGAKDALGAIQDGETNSRRDDLIGLIKPNGKDRRATVIPIKAAGRRFGALILLRTDGEFDEKDLVLAEYAATILMMDARRMAGPDAAAREGQGREQVRSALAALSLSEAEAVWHILSELRDNEGIVVASRVADRVGITRSVIVNALRKLESAMVIRSRSLGMKGTYIKVLSPYLMDELRRLRSRR
jgi:transcriptional pleiotropic repressor